MLNGAAGIPFCCTYFAHTVFHTWIIVSLRLQDSVDWLGTFDIFLHFAFMFSSHDLITIGQQITHPTYHTNAPTLYKKTYITKMSNTK